MQAPRLPSLFKSRKPQTFDLPTRYYDPLREKHQRLSGEQGGKEEERVRDFKSHWQKGRRTGWTSGRSLRLGVILAALFAAAWWLLFDA